LTIISKQNVIFLLESHRLLYVQQKKNILVNGTLEIITIKVFVLIKVLNLAPYRMHQNTSF